MFEFLKRKTKEATITLTEHVVIVAKKVGEARKDLDAQIAQDKSLFSRVARERNQALIEVQQERETVARLVSQKRALADRLNQIAALETPNCAHIGKRMARIARGEDAQGREKGEAA